MADTDRTDRRLPEPVHRRAGIDIADRRRRDGRRTAAESAGRGGRTPGRGIAASRSRRCSTSSTWRSAATLADEQRVFVDALGYRKGKDVELRQMAKFLAEKAQGDRPRSATRSAESVRAPHRAHGGRRSAWRVDRRASATRSRRPSHLGAEVDAGRSRVRSTAIAVATDRPSDADGHVLHRRHHRRDRDAAGPRRIGVVRAQRS